jgi:hypothetical protein
MDNQAANLPIFETSGYYFTSTKMNERSLFGEKVVKSPLGNIAGIDK